MNIYKLQELMTAIDDDQTVDFGTAITHFAALVEIARLADLINAEFRTDPTSVQCFDLHAIVHPLDKALKELEAV